MAKPGNCAARIFVVFRNDDPSARSDPAHEREIYSLFEKCGLPQTIGVIPNVTVSDYHQIEGGGEARLDTNVGMVELLREHVQRTGAEIALHGYTHRTNRHSRPARREFFEFRGQSLEEQERLIRQGAAILEQALGVKPTTFIPPWNRFDQATVAACERAGCRVISADAFTPDCGQLAAFGCNSSLGTIEARLEQARRSERRFFLSLLFHSPALKSAEEKRRLERVVRAVAADPACEVLTVREAVERFGDQLRLLNQAGRNLVDPPLAVGTPRARASVYLRWSAAGGRTDRLAPARQRAAELYWEGDYTGSAAAGEAIDARCAKLVWVCRVGALLAWCVAVWTLRQIFGGTLDGHRLEFALGLVLLIASAGMTLVRRATAPDTKRELAWLCGACATGALLGWAL